ncbi:MAG: BatA and WFA domain-containing protein [Chthoniobacterales bacterium]
MTFLWPAAWSILLLAIPITVLYLVKTQLPKKIVSTLLFWNNISPRLRQQPFWRKLRRWVSLALQLLLLLFIVLAFTQPQPSAESLKPHRTIFVLDASAGMRAEDVSPSRWGQALDNLRARVNRMRVFDEAAIVLGTSSPKILCGWTKSQRTLKNSVEGVTASLDAQDIRPALDVASNLAASRENSQVILLSDGVLENPLELKDKPGVEWVKVGGKPINTGITLFSARRSAVSAGEYQLSAAVESNDPMETTVQFELIKNGALMDVQTLQLKPGVPWRKSWQDQDRGETNFTARITGMKKDDLAEDNEAAAKIPALRKVSILLVSESNHFLEAALNSMDLIEWKRVQPDEDYAARALASDLVIYYRTAPPEKDRPQNMILIVPPGEGFWGKNGDMIEAPLVSDWQKESIPLRYMSLDQVRLNRAKHFTPSPGAVVFAESFGNALIFGDWESSPRWVTLAFDLDQSDFVLRTAFPVFLGNLVQSLRSTDAENAPLPGPVATNLTINLKDTGNAAATGTFAWWTVHPLWWWLIALAAIGLLTEWWLYSRRITE